MAANFLVDTALTTLLRAATNSSYEPLRQRARKILQEEEAHRVHAEGWIRRLAADELMRPTLAHQLGRMWDDAFTWFGQADDPTVGDLVRAGLLSAQPDALRQHLVDRVGPLLTQVGLADDLLHRALPWHRWDAAGRRLRAAT